MFIEGGHSNLSPDRVASNGVTLLLPKTADAEVEVSASLRPFVLVVGITFAAEVAAIWTTSKVDGNFFVPPLLVLGLGVVGFIITFRLDVMSHKRSQKAASWVAAGEREPSRTYRRGRLLIVVGTTVIAVAGVIFVIPLKMWVAEGAANRVAEQLIANAVNPVCTKSSSDLDAVGLLMSAKEVCAYGSPDPSVPSVWFQGTYAPYTGIGIAKGLVYAPSGLGQVGTICARHLVGSWWAYYSDADGQGCPIGYNSVGSTP